MLNKSWKLVIKMIEIFEIFHRRFDLKGSFKPNQLNTNRVKTGVGRSLVSSVSSSVIGGTPLLGSLEALGLSSSRPPTRQREGEQEGLTCLATLYNL